MQGFHPTLHDHLLRLAVLLGHYGGNPRLALFRSSPDGNFISLDTEIADVAQHQEKGAASARAGGYLQMWCTGHHWWWQCAQVFLQSKPHAVHDGPRFDWEMADDEWGAIALNDASVSKP